MSTRVNRTPTDFSPSLGRGRPYGIVPEDVTTDTRLTANERLVFIHMLCRVHGWEFTASQIGQKLFLKEGAASGEWAYEQASKALKKLASFGYVEASQPDPKTRTIRYRVFNIDAGWESQLDRAIEEPTVVESSAVETVEEKESSPFGDSSSHQDCVTGEASTAEVSLESEDDREDSYSQLSRFERELIEYKRRNAENNRRCRERERERSRKPDLVGLRV